MKRITRNNINKKNLVVLGYCQCQTVINLFAGNYKIGYNAGIYGWNYDLYHINGVDVTTGYKMPYYKYGNKDIKNNLITFDNKLQKMEYSDIYKNFEALKQEFLEIFK